MERFGTRETVNEIIERYSDEITLEDELDARERIRRLAIEEQDKRQQRRLQFWISLALIGVFGAGSFACLTLFFLQAFQVSTLTPGEMSMLANVTYGSIGGLVLMVLRGIFQ